MALVNWSLRNSRLPSPPVVSQVKRMPRLWPFFLVDSLMLKRVVATLLYNQFS